MAVITHHTRVPQKEDKQRTTTHHHRMCDNRSEMSISCVSTVRLVFFGIADAACITDFVAISFS